MMCDSFSFPPQYGVRVRTSLLHGSDAKHQTHAREKVKQIPDDDVKANDSVKMVERLGDSGVLHEMTSTFVNN